jgi:fructose-specific phosphotransferase system IIC component
MKTLIDAIKLLIIIIIGTCIFVSMIGGTAAFLLALIMIFAHGSLFQTILFGICFIFLVAYCVKIFENHSFAKLEKFNNWLFNR